MTTLSGMIYPELVLWGFSRREVAVAAVVVQPVAIRVAGGTRSGAERDRAGKPGPWGATMMLCDG